MAAYRMPATVVAGLQWGDEGKGKIVDLLAADFDYVVRYNGGANAGHTVVVGDERFALHLVPSGVLRPGVTGVIGNGVALDPEVLVGEIQDLERRGVAIGDNLAISNRAHLVLPHHKQTDGLQEAAITVSMGGERRIGTTGRGIGPCYADKAIRSTAVRAGDLLDAAGLVERLHHVALVKNATLAPLAELAGEPFRPIDPDELAEQCRAYAAALGRFIRDTSALLHAALCDGRRILFEGANGFLLDVDHGTYPFVTSSNSSALGLYTGAGVPGHAVGEILGVVKAYTSRVGAGPFPTELDDQIGATIRERGHEYGTTTGRPRRCGWLDLFAVRYAARTSGATALAVTLLDVLAGLEELEVCTAYKVRGRKVEGYPSTVADLEAVEPVCERLPGFAGNLDTARSYRDLPGTAQRYVEAIEDHVEVPVRIVSVGPERTQTLRRSA